MSNRDDLSTHHVVQLRKTIETRSVVFCKNAQWKVVFVDNDHCAVSALVNQTQRFANRSVGGHGDRSLDHHVARLNKLHDILDNVERDVLGQNNQPTATSNCFGHAPTCNCCHVGNNHRNGCSKSVWRSQVDRLPRGDCRHTWNHKYVVIGEVIVGCAVQKPHDLPPHRR